LRAIDPRERTLRIAYNFALENRQQAQARQAQSFRRTERRYRGACRSASTQTPAQHPPPGQFLLAEFTEPHALSANALATALHVPANRIGAIIKGQRAITADTALRLGRYFGTSAELWLNLQQNVDLRAARAALKTEIASSMEPLTALATGKLRSA